MRNIVPPDDKFISRQQTNKTNQIQRNQIRVLGNNNFIKGAENNPNMDSYVVPPNEIEERNLNLAETHSIHRNIYPNIVTPSSETKIEISSKRIESKEEPAIGSPSNDSIVGSLPRTLSTSVLRIKHRRSFWEKVVG